ncbi:MAG: hypothetical protein AAB372_01020 [Patescibacteria group bacterium]
MAKKHTGAKIAAGVGVGLAAAAAAGSLFLYGRQGAKNRKVVTSWALKAKAEVLEQVEKMKKLDRKDFEQVVDTITKRYAKAKRTSVKEAATLAHELKSHWKDIQKKIK